MEKRVYTAVEAAEFLALSKDNKPDSEKVKTLARQRKLGHIRAGRSYLFKEEHLEQYLADNEVLPTPRAVNPRALTDTSLRRMRQA
jgi:excisionase family DNA binding protein